MSEMIDQIPLTKSVMFVGDYFTLVSTVVLAEELREQDEDDEEFAIRLASVWIKEHYGWDLPAVSNEIGIVAEGWDEED
jgi:hypothetical protein